MLVLLQLDRVIRDPELGLGPSGLERARPYPRPAIKWLQKFAHGTLTHKRWYGMRSLVESNNKVLKGKRYENMGDPGKRSGRGFAFQYIVATLMAVSANTRKIARFFEKDAKSQLGGPLPRTRRRKTAIGTPLERATDAQQLAPPQ